MKYNATKTPPKILFLFFFGHRRICKRISNREVSSFFRSNYYKAVAKQRKCKSQIYDLWVAFRVGNARGENAKFYAYFFLFRLIRWVSQCKVFLSTNRCYTCIDESMMQRRKHSQFLKWYVCVLFFFFNFIAFSLVFNSIICYFKCVQEPIRLRPRECMCVTVCKSFSVSFGLSMCVRVFLFDARHTRNIKNKIK